MRFGPVFLLGVVLLGAALLFFRLVMPDAARASTRVAPRPGAWRVTLKSPGGELPFLMELRADPYAQEQGQGLRAVMRNGVERIEVPVTQWEDGALVFDLRHYDSEILARADGTGTRLTGEWIKRRGPDGWTRLPLEATQGEAARFSGAATPPTVAGRWRVQFDGSTEPAVGLFEAGPGDVLLGTFETTTGDFRHLEGQQEGETIRLSCFDGAHAFLFAGRQQADGTLAGDFWSSDDHHETWTARRDDSAALPDAFAQATWTDLPLSELVFPDLDGVSRALDDPAFAGRARIVQLFGSWCPNCHDASLELVRLSERYKARGLSIVGLAFERSGDSQRDAAQVRLYGKRHGVTWPLLLAGTADKAQATERIQLLDRVRSFPTTIFLHADGRVRAVHSGFSGPATGEDFRAQQRKFEALIEELLAEEQAALSGAGTTPRVAESTRAASLGVISR